MIAGAVYQGDKVAVVYHQPIPKYLKIGSAEVVFNCQYGISLALVDEGQVPTLLSHLGGCCGQKKQVITLASPALYDHWLNGKGGRK